MPTLDGNVKRTKILNILYKVLCQKVSLYLKVGCKRINKAEVDIYLKDSFIYGLINIYLNFFLF